jgi:uncharacterized protein involved in response to NO
MNPFPPRGGGPQFVDHRSHQPTWQRIHRSPFFWLAAVFIFVAMVVYVMSNNLATAPGNATQPPVPAVAP